MIPEELFKRIQGVQKSTDNTVASSVHYEVRVSVLRALSTFTEGHPIQRIVILAGSIISQVSAEIDAEAKIHRES